MGVEPTNRNRSLPAHVGELACPFHATEPETREPMGDQPPPTNHRPRRRPSRGVVIGAGSVILVGLAVTAGVIHSRARDELNAKLAVCHDWEKTAADRLDAANFSTARGALISAQSTCGYAELDDREASALEEKKLLGLERSITEKEKAATAAASAMAPVLVGQVRSVGGLAIDASSIYVADVDENDDNLKASIVRIPHGGGASVVLATKQRTVQGLTATAAGIFWAIEGDHDANKPDMILMAPVAGGKVVPVAETQVSSSDDGSPLVADGAFLYYVSSTARGISRVPLTGGKPTKIADLDPESLVSVMRLAVDGNNIYWGLHGGSTVVGSIMMAPLVGGKTPVQLATVDQLGGLATDGVNVYWTDKGENAVRAVGTLKRVPTTGGPTVTLASGLPGPRGVAVDDRAVYWANNSDGSTAMATRGGAVFRAAKDGTKVTVMARDQSNPSYVTVDATYLYWGNSTGGMVWRVAK